MSESTKDLQSEFNNAMVQLRVAEEKFNEAIQNVWNVVTEIVREADERIDR